MSFNVPNPKSDRKRVVIVGGGFGGLKLANKLRRSNFQVVLIDKTTTTNSHPSFIRLLLQV